MGVPGQRVTWFNSRWFLISGGLVLVLLGIGLGRAWYGQYRVHQEILRLEAEAKRLEAKRFETLKALRYAESFDFVESKARTELNLVKPGENVVVIKLPGEGRQRTEPGQAPKTVIESAEPPVSNPIKWWRYFFGN